MCWADVKGQGSGDGGWRYPIGQVKNFDRLYVEFGRIRNMRQKNYGPIIEDDFLIEE
jgi:hypothetical protein